MAHYGNVVHHVGPDLPGSGRNVHLLAETYGDTVTLNDHLRAWADDETGDRSVGHAG